MLVVAMCSLALAACSTNYNNIPGVGSSHAADDDVPVRVASKRFHPRPSRALLAAPPEPDCSFKGGTREDTGDALRTKLDYERQCYRQAEMILRDRLRQLQASMSAVKHREPAR